MRATPRLPTEAEARAILSGGDGPGVAVTREGAHDPRLEPRRLSTSVPDSRARLLEVIATLPGWRLRDASATVLWAARAAPVWPLADDVLLLLEPRGEGTLVHARSASPLGRLSLDHGRRDLAELWTALDARLAPRG